MLRSSVLRRKKLPPPSVPTPSVAQVFEKVKKFTQDSIKAKGINQKLMEFIALDDQPFSVVEDVGFRRLVEHLEPRYSLPSRRYFSDVCLPDMYNVVAAHIHELLTTDISAISFTTDIWSSDVSPTCMLSLTGQWIDKDFKLQKILLHEQEFTGSHTAEAISSTFNTMLETWKIDKVKVHAVVRDNARNITKAMDVSDVASLPCVAHTLQLAVNEGLLCQRSISDVIAICRRIVGHFKHSPLAYSRLHSVQIQMGMQPKILQQDVSTRWNSTFDPRGFSAYKKQAIAAYSADYVLPVTLTAHHWCLIENTVSILYPFEQLTREMSASGASAADVIPSIVALKRLLSKDLETDQGVKTTKKTLLDAVTKRFAKNDSEPLYCIATLLDPRYKDNYFDTDKKQAVRMMLQAQLDLNNESDGNPAVRHPEDNPKAKKPRKDSEHAPSLCDMFDEVLEENLSHGFRINPTMPQMDAYLAEIPIERSENPLQYWCVNQGRFPSLAQTARKYLCAPSTSTDSERLFSAASNVLDSKRNRLHCEKSEKLLFIKKNLPLFLKQQP